MQYPASRGYFLLWTMLILLVAGGAALLGWWFEGSGASLPRAGWAGLVWLAAALAVWYSRLNTVTGTLRWDGVLWHLDHAGAGFEKPALEGTLWVRLDMQDRLWVCMQTQGGRRNWLWLERRDAPLRWGDLRRAVYSRPGPDGSPEDGVAVARPEA